MMEIKAAMAGNLWKLLVSVGDTVTEGQDVAILESMKMEIPISADQDGTVIEVNFAEDDFVNEGDVIAIIE